MKWMITFLGLVLIFSGNKLGEALQCYWVAYQAFGGGWQSVICETPAWVELKFIAPFQMAGALICLLGLWLMKRPNKSDINN